MHIFIEKPEDRCNIGSVIGTSLNSKTTILVSCCNSISIKPNERLSVYSKT